MGLKGAIGTTGETYDHWLHSTLAFSVIINLVNLKMFLETVYWNWVSILAGLVSLILYYVILLGFSLNPISRIVQPELDGKIFELFSNLDTIYTLIVLPFACLIPDMTIKFL